MSENLDEKLCNERKKNVDKILDDHEKRLNGHSDRIDKLEQRGAAVDQKMGDLCDTLNKLTNTLMWGFGIMVTITLFILGYLIKIK